MQLPKKAKGAGQKKLECRLLSERLKGIS